MNYRTITALGILAALVFAAGAVWAGAGDLKIVTDGVGKHITDGDGRTLYYYKMNAKDVNACAGACAEKWPVFYSEKIVPPPGTEAKDFGEITRTGGIKQTTFKGWPLYYFQGDKKAGDPAGQGIKDVWFVVSPPSIEPYF